MIICIFWSFRVIFSLSLCVSLPRHEDWYVIQRARLACSTMGCKTRWVAVRPSDVFARERENKLPLSGNTQWIVPGEKKKRCRRMRERYNRKNGQFCLLCSHAKTWLHWLDVYPGGQSRAMVRRIGLSLRKKAKCNVRYASY